ncbi:MAG TPA: LysR family transcriptional regulator [Candidatus Acidoferrales bacterium]|nr:LysR family transcriptional regulator [Candidatus Acidoferrales bacterium]
MEIHQVQTFLAVLNYGSFHRAAEALRVSQPAVSGRIRALEDSLGVKLFNRGIGAPMLSEAGQAFRPQAEELLRVAAQARQAVHELQPSSGGALRVAAALSICTYFLPEVMQSYREAHPNVMVNLRSGNSQKVLGMVLEGETDIGLVRSVNHQEIETQMLRDDPLILVGHPAHPNCRKRQAKLEEVRAWPLIFYDRGSSDWTFSQGLFRREGWLPNTVLEVETIESAKKMVERKLGFAFLPLIALSDELRNGKLRAIEITDAEPLHRSLDVIHLRSRPLSSNAREFMKVLERAAAVIVPSKKKRFWHPARHSG